MSDESTQSGPASGESTDPGWRILDDLHAALLGYVIFPSPSAVAAVTLWIAATYAQRAWNCATRLVIKAPEKRCGKSRLLDIIEATCHRPLITVNISPAALVRSIGDDPPTLLLDESDAVFGKKTADNHEDLRGILNAGHQRNRPYIRWDANTRTAENCPTFAMAALAGIGDMPDTIEDRAVIVSMRRRAPHETVQPYRTRRDAPDLHRLADRLGAWIGTVTDDLADATPDMPLEDRAADNWEPLIAIADAAGGTWPVRARAAAQTLVAASDEHDAERSLGVRLLNDVRTVMNGVPDGLVFISSADLVERLHALEESPWRDFELTTRQLAARLKTYGVRVGHDTTKTRRGYKRADFVDAWDRYLSPEGKRPHPSERPEPAEILTSGTDASRVTDGSDRPTSTGSSDASPRNIGPPDARTLPDVPMPEPKHACEQHPEAPTTTDGKCPMCILDGINASKATVTTTTTADDLHTCPGDGCTTPTEPTRRGNRLHRTYCSACSAAEFDGEAAG